MAVNLTAVFKVRDQGTAKLRKISQEMNKVSEATRKVNSNSKRMKKAIDDVGKQANRTNKVLTNFGKNLRNQLTGFASRLNPLAAGFVSIAGAAGAAYTAVKLFNATVGEAMKMEQSKVVIGAMFNDENLAKQYMQMLDRVSIDSPVLDSQAMYENSKAFITASKDVEQLEKMWDLAERLVAIDPVQGVDGAVLALRELFSGDSMSMVERFEMSRDVMNDIKKMDLADQLTALDEYFNKIGLTTKVIDDMGGSALGMWAQVQERWQLIMRQMGEPSIRVVSEFLGNLLSRLEGPEMQKFAEWGANVIKNMLQGLTDSAIALYDWFTALQNDPKFQEQTTLIGKIEFIMADIAARMREWYDNGGKEAIENFGRNIAETLVAILNNSQPFFDLGIKLGGALGQGIMEGVWNGTKANLGFESVTDRNAKIQELGKQSGASDFEVKLAEEATKPFLTTFFGLNSHYSGLDNVPYDGYTARLHKGERILTAQESKEYESGGNGFVFNYNGTMQVREEADIQKIAMALYNEFRREAAQRG